MGGAVDVDHLKGVNMGFRRSAVDGLSFDRRLRGFGAQYRNDLAFSLELKRRGWRIVYDPAVSVDHFSGQRYGDDQRGVFSASAVEEAAYNETLILMDHLHFHGRVAHILFAFFVGDKYLAGVAQSIRLLPHEGFVSLMRLIYSSRGRLRGFLDWFCSKFGCRR